MSIDSIGRVSENPAATQQSVVQLDDFLKIFLTQLNYQDPLDPLDSREFLAQLAQFSSVQLQSVTSDNVEALLGVESTTQVLGLLNKTVEVTGETGMSVGEITSIRFDSSNSGAPLLTVKVDANTILQDVSPSRVTLVR